MSQKIRLCAVGIGAIFKTVHAKPLLENPDVEIVAVCDIKPERAEAFAKEHKIPHVFTDYRDLIALKNVDAVDICMPNLFHSEIAVAALKAGKHVFTEKPTPSAPPRRAKWPMPPRPPAKRSWRCATTASRPIRSS
jgi:predicted dehydrogenase